MNEELEKFCKENFENIINMFSKCANVKGDKNVKPKHSQFTNNECKPMRETIIKDDDVLNLKIELENCNTIDEFLNNI